LDLCNIDKDDPMKSGVRSKSEMICASGQQYSSIRQK